MNNQVEEMPKTNKTGFWAAFAIFAILILLIGGFAYGYLQLFKVNTGLASAVTDLQKQNQQDQGDITELKKSLSDLKEITQKSAELSNKQESLIAEWQAAQQHDLNQWHVAEAQYLVRLANDHVQFTHNISMAITLLQRASQILQPLNDAALLEVQKSLASNLANLQGLAQIDITNIYLRLSALNNQVDQLPLPDQPLEQDKTAAETQTPAGRPWWRIGLDKSLKALSHIVIVKKNVDNQLPLVMPEEKMFFFQNLHASFEGAMWGVLHRNQSIYQASLNNLDAWVKAYFVQDARQTKAMLSELEELKKIDVDAPKANFADTLTLFDTYFASVKAQ